MDLAIFNFINVTLKNSFFDFVMPILSDANYWKVPLGLIFVGFVVFGRKKGIVMLLLCIAAVGLSDFVCGNILKPLFHRPRPLGGVTFSFPSNHAANLFAAATMIFYFYKKVWVAAVVFVIAALVGYSRIYTTSHYPSDVVAGALIGIGFSYFVIFVYKKLQEKKAANAK